MTTENPIKRYAEGLALGAAEEQEAARKAAEQCPECQVIGGHSVFCSRRPAPAYVSAPVCECYSCNRECGGTVHPDSCGPVEADAEGRPICQACRDLAQVWGDHRTGLQAAITQDRIRVAVKFGESAWINPESARAFAAILTARADELDRERAEAARADSHAGLCWCQGRTAPHPYHHGTARP